ncbi:MAG TPA: helix-turn-helix domain-containing protein [Acidobacteriota bacterium]|nr:helix-turn-helix domain-containing protein [Acidobacteriota bacterium]
MTARDLPLHEQPHVLLVDDSLDELRLLSATLRAERFRLTVANDGRKGYQRAVVSQPDIILLDVSMPELDGFSACRLLKADPATRHIPVIFLTAKNEPEERLHGLRLGGVDYVSKPVLAEEVVARIRIHLRGGETRPIQTEPAARDPDDVVFGAATAEIRDRLETLPSVPELARMVGTHEKRLGQIFRDRVGMTVSTFVSEERIRAARRLLSETDMSVQQIAEQVGFGTGANFTTAFRKRMGMTPTHYRRGLQDKEDATE